MARLGRRAFEEAWRQPPADERGAVYVEFIFAFMPIFLLFLAIAQVAQLASAKLVVAHAAARAVRTAVVVLNDSPRAYDKAPRGDLSQGQPQPDDGLEGLLARLELVRAATTCIPTRPQSPSSVPQQGARMAPIRTAAERSGGDPGDGDQSRAEPAFRFQAAPPVQRRVHASGECHHGACRARRNGLARRTHPIQRPSHRARYLSLSLRCSARWSADVPFTEQAPRRRSPSRRHSPAVCREP